MIKPGDLVVVIYLEGAYYPDACKPGTIGTVRSRCICSSRSHHMRGQVYYNVELPTDRFCVNARVLRKIDADGRTVVKWDTVPWQPARERAES